MTVQQLTDRLSAMPISQLEAIYNNCWRNHHNDIDKDRNKLVMDTIELVCGIKKIAITGKGGSWELVNYHS